MEEGDNMENENKEIINFDDLFNQEPKKAPIEPVPDMKNKYTTGILAYLLIMNVFAIIVYLIFNQFASLKVTYEEEELMMYQVAGNVNAITLIDENTYDFLYEDYLDDYIYVIGDFGGYVVIVNRDNLDAETLLLNSNLIPTIDSTVLMRILDGQQTYTWSDGGAPIEFVFGKDQVLPSYVQTDYIEVDGPMTELSDAAYSFMNFLIYLALLPVLLYLFKFDIVKDFNEFKLIKQRWLPMIAMGYFYVLLGNVAASYLQELFAYLLNTNVSEAVNQLTIEASLRSNGVIFMVISAVFMGPIVEELVFRKAIFGLIKNDYVALFVSALAFGAIHLLSESSVTDAIVNGVQYFAMGAVFGSIYLYAKKNVMIPILVHMASNAISIILIMFYI